MAVKLSRYIYTIGGVVLGLGLGLYVGKVQLSNSKDLLLSGIHPIRQQSGDYKFINPLLAYDLPESTEYGEYTELAKKFNDIINSEKKQHKVEEVSVYFRGGQGRWVGINDSQSYYPASLLKVVVMIAYFRQAESNPGLLNKELVYTPQIQANVTSSEFNVASVLKLNSSYKVSDLLNDMIVDSDNGATFVLINSLDSKLLDETYTDLGLQGPSDAGDYRISAKDYSFFFRILYNATYLNTEYSEKALSLLSQATFKDGLVAGLPDTTVVAHKFGEHILTDAQGQQTGIELHDCGLVYGTHSFLICVMTRGQNSEDLEQTIKTITAAAYEQVQKD